MKYCSRLKRQTLHRENK
ncbi:50S ribosomal protein L33 [Bacillus sp. B15-48]|nr:50S ribosomal protein L33 [Bacillus sp. B15-48]